MIGALGVIGAVLFSRVALRAICMMGVAVADAGPGVLPITGVPEPIDEPEEDEAYPTCFKCGHVGPDVYIVDKKCVDCLDDEESV